MKGSLSLKIIQENVKIFCEKIKTVNINKINKEFMTIARIESLILRKGMKDAINRATNYVEAGADGIMIHSRKNNPKEIFEFSKKFKKSKYFKFLVAVPSSYSKTYEKDLIKHGFSIVIYANQMLRASYLSMNKVAKTILKNSRSYESEKEISSISELLKYSI